MGHLHTAKVKGEKLQRKVRGRVDSLHSHVASTVVVINAKSGAQPRHTILGLFEEREPYSAQPGGLRERGSGRWTGSQERGWGKREKVVSRRHWCAFQEVSGRQVVVLENEFRATTVARRHGALVFCPSPVNGTRLPTLPALTMAWISPWLSARLYTAGSSIRPWKPRPGLVPSARPMVSGRVFGTMGPPAGRVVTTCPLT